MATFKIDDVEYDTDKLDTTQKRVVGLYQKSLQDEGEALNNLEMARAARIELGRKLKELVIDSEKKNKRKYRLARKSRSHQKYLTGRQIIAPPLKVSPVR